MSVIEEQLDGSGRVVGVRNDERDLAIVVASQVLVVIPIHLDQYAKCQGCSDSENHSRDDCDLLVVVVESHPDDDDRADGADGQKRPEEYTARRDVCHRKEVHIPTPRQSSKEDGNDAADDPVQDGQPQPPGQEPDDGFIPA